MRMSVSSTSIYFGQNLFDRENESAASAAISALVDIERARAEHVRVLEAGTGAGMISAGGPSDDPLRRPPVLNSR